MKREQAIKASNTLLGCCDADNGLCVDIINSIYDDIDSRICGNCRHHKHIEKSFKKCKVLEINTSNDFGCNLFERKEK